MQLKHFLPQNEILRRHVNHYHIANYEERQLRNDVVIYPNYLTNISLQDNFESRLADGVFTFREYSPRKLNINILGRFTKPLIARIKGKIKSLSVVFNPGGISFFTDKSFDELVPAIHGEFHEWDEKETELQELLYINDIQELTGKLDAILLSFYRPFQNDILFETLSMLHNNFAEHSVEEIARTVGVNRKTLLRQFKKHIGISISDYRRILRFREAISLYQHNENLTKLAYEVFFCDQSHFIKDFQKLAGETPKKVFKEAGFVSETPFFLKITDS